jgi:hypothetical protein
VRLEKSLVSLGTSAFVREGKTESTTKSGRGCTDAAALETMLSSSATAEKLT